MGETEGRGGRVYGYSTVWDGESSRTVYMVNEDEALIVQVVFEMYAGGATLQGIADLLNHERHPSPTGKAWGMTTVRGLLLNERYAGRFIWNRHRWARLPDGRRSPQERPREEWVVEERPDLAIVSASLWERVQGRFQKRSEAPSACRSVPELFLTHTPKTARNRLRKYAKRQHSQHWRTGVSGLIIPRSGVRFSPSPPKTPEKS
jgi:hypothetical protein